MATSTDLAAGPALDRAVAEALGLSGYWVQIMATTLERFGG